RCNLGILRNEGVGAAQNRRGGTPVPGERNQFCSREALEEKVEGVAGSAAKPVDALVGIADSKNILPVRVGSGEFLQDFDLGEVRVLELIHQNEARTLAGTGENFGIRGEQIVGANDHVIEGAEVALAKHALDGFEDKSDLAATSESFLVADFAGISGFRNARNGKRAALDA